MPRDNDKDNASPRGRRDRPSGGKGRSGVSRGPEKKFAKRGLGSGTKARNAKGSVAPMPERLMAPSHMARSLIQARANLTRTNVRGGRRVETMVTPSVQFVLTGTIAPAAIGPLPIVRPVVTAKSVPTPRAEIVLTISATTARRATGIRETPGLPRVFPTGSPATESPTRREMAAARNVLTRRVARAFGKTATGRNVTGPMATGRQGKIAARARISAAATGTAAI